MVSRHQISRSGRSGHLYAGCVHLLSHGQSFTRALGTDAVRSARVATRLPSMPRIRGAMSAFLPPVDKGHFLAQGRDHAAVCPDGGIMGDGDPWCLSVWTENSRPSRLRPLLAFLAAAPGVRSFCPPSESADTARCDTFRTGSPGGLKYSSATAPKGLPFGVPVRILRSAPNNRSTPSCVLRKAQVPVRRKRSYVPAANRGPDRFRGFDAS